MSIFMLNFSIIRKFVKNFLVLFCLYSFCFAPFFGCSEQQSKAEQSKQKDKKYQYKILYDCYYLDIYDSPESLPIGNPSTQIIRRTFSKYLDSRASCTENMTQSLKKRLEEDKAKGNIVPQIISVLHGHFTKNDIPQAAYMIDVGECSAVINNSSKYLAIYEGLKLITLVDAHPYSYILNKSDLDNDGFDEIFVGTASVDKKAPKFAVLSCKNNKFDFIYEPEVTENSKIFIRSSEDGKMPEFFIVEDYEERSIKRHRPKTEFSEVPQAPASPILPDPLPPVSTQVESSSDSIQSNKPAKRTHPTGASAICCDGTYSYSKSRRGTCSHHGGVCEWLY